LHTILLSPAGYFGRILNLNANQGATPPVLLALLLLALPLLLTLQKLLLLPELGEKQRFFSA